jgi:LacI family transcriptional regulator
MTEGSGTRRTTIGDVARHARVDKAIVSRIVNADRRLSVRPETRARVEAAIAELHYVPNSTARTLRTSKTRTFGLLIPDFANPVYAEIIAGAEMAAAREGFVLMTASTATHVSTSDRPTRYLDILDRDRIDGLLIAGGHQDSRALNRLTEVGLPWLIVNNRDTSLKRYVALDDRRAAFMATNHLLGLGHRAIAHIAGPDDSETAARRLAGYQDAMAGAGLPVDEWQIQRADYTPQGGFDAALELVRHSRAMTGLFVANVSSAVGAIDALHRNGIEVPRDVSVIGLHDHALAMHLVPSLTTVRMPLRELGERSVELLRTTEPSAPVEEILDGPIEIIVRDSTAPPAIH